MEKFRSNEHYGAALERSTIFLCRSSLGSTSIESCQLADLKYAIFSRTGCKTKKLPRSKLFLSMVFRKGSLRDRHQNTCEVLFFLEGETHASQIWPTLRKSYTISKTFQKPLNVRGITRVLLVIIYINRLVCVCQCVYKRL